MGVKPVAKIAASVEIHAGLKRNQADEGWFVSESEREPEGQASVPIRLAGLRVAEARVEAVIEGHPRQPWFEMAPSFIH